MLYIWIELLCGALSVVWFRHDRVLQTSLFTFITNFLMLTVSVWWLKTNKWINLFSHIIIQPLNRLSFILKSWASRFMLLEDFDCLNRNSLWILRHCFSGIAFFPSLYQFTIILTKQSCISHTCRAQLGSFSDSGRWGWSDQLVGAPGWMVQDGLSCVARLSPTQGLTF